MTEKLKHPDLSASDAIDVAKEACRILLEKLSIDVKLISVCGSALTDYYVVGYVSHSFARMTLISDWTWSNCLLIRVNCGKSYDRLH